MKRHVSVTFDLEVEGPLKAAVDEFIADVETGEGHGNTHYTVTGWGWE